MRKLWMLGLPLALVLAIHFAVSAVSANVTLSGPGREFEADTTQRTATVQAGNKGGSILNKSADSVWIDLNGGTVTTSSGSTSIELQTRVSIKLPNNCATFTFKTASGTSYIEFVAP